VESILDDFLADRPTADSAPDYARAAFFNYLFWRLLALTAPDGRSDAPPVPAAPHRGVAEEDPRNQGVSAHFRPPRSRNTMSAPASPHHPPSNAGTARSRVAELMASLAAKSRDTAAAAEPSAQRIEQGGSAQRPLTHPDMWTALATGSRHAVFFLPGVLGVTRAGASAPGVILPVTTCRHHRHRRRLPPQLTIGVRQSAHQSRPSLRHLAGRRRMALRSVGSDDAIAASGLRPRREPG